MKLKTKLMMLVIVPIVVLGLGLAIIAYIMAENSLVDSIEAQLQIACEGYTDDLYAFQLQNIDITVFEGDTRVASSIDGVVGTKASDAVIEAVWQNKETYFSRNADVNGTPYYGFYIPVDDGMLFAGKPQATVKSELNSLLRVILICAIVLVIIAAVVAYIVANILVKAIDAVETLVGKVADGDLTTKMDERKGRDEISVIWNSVRTMLGNLTRIATESKNVSKDVYASSTELHRTSSSTLRACEEISKAIEDVAQNNTSQAGVASDITAEIGIMQEKTADISECVTGIEGCSTILVDNCNDMRVKIADTQKNSSMMSESVIRIKDKIDETNKVIAKMSEILVGIEDIASQTKLLSLNASIEAARAGELGKGFSVVADNIRTLSENTAQELVRIKDIIQNITGDFKACAESIDVAVKNNEESSKSISQVISSFEAVDNAIQDTSRQVQLISAAVEETNTQLQGVSHDIVTLGQASESNAAASEEVNASVEELTALMNSVDESSSALTREAQVLEEVLKIFKL